MKSLERYDGIHMLLTPPFQFPFQLDALCRRMAPDAWINPHKSVLGLGNYDVNVVMAALEGRGMAAKWFDKRR